jgi:hypothetical protein
MPIVLRILTYGRKLVRRQTAMMCFSGMFVQLVVGMPMPERQCGCTERHHQAGKKCNEGANRTSEHLIQN